jgi:hypothetical protein
VPEHRTLTPGEIARLQAAQRALTGRFADHSATKGAPPSQSPDGDALRRLQSWALERAPYGAEVILRRCEVCGAEEYTNEAGRILIDHRYGPHHPTTVPAHEGEALPVRRSFGERDDDDEIFGIPTPRRAAGYHLTTGDTSHA